MKKYLVKTYEYIRRKLLSIQRKMIVPDLPENSDGKVYLNLGCSMNTGKEFINIDVVSLPHIHHIQDITNLSNFDDESVDLIYASHVIEHLPKRKLLAILLEWKRVLKKGGVLRFSVPDFDNLIEVYHGEGNDVDSVMDQILGQDPPFDNHYTLWNFKQAEKIFTGIGFVNIREWSPATSDHHDFSDRSSRLLKAGNKTLLLSLNFEVTKK